MYTLSTQAGGMRSSGEDFRRGRTSPYTLIARSARKNEDLRSEVFAKTSEIPSGTLFLGGAADRSAHSVGPGLIFVVIFCC